MSTQFRFALRSCLLAALLLLLAACQREAPQPEAPAVEPPKPGPIPQGAMPAPDPRGEEPPGPPELPPLFRDVARRTFQCFWDAGNEPNGLTPDRFPSRPFASIASVGFSLTAYPIGIENGWV